MLLQFLFLVHRKPIWQNFFSGNCCSKCFADFCFHLHPRPKLGCVHNEQQKQLNRIIIMTWFFSWKCIEKHGFTGCCTQGRFDLLYCFWWWSWSIKGKSAYLLFPKNIDWCKCWYRSSLFKTWHLLTLILVLFNSFLKVLLLGKREEIVQCKLFTIN